MIHVPQNYSYIECYLTLRCNLRCPYCINEHTGVTRNRNELTAKQWCLGLNNIDTGGKPITFGGGEPTVHKEFYEIVDGLNPDIKIDLLTNLVALDIDEFIKRIPPERFTQKGEEYKAIRVSYHPKEMKMEELVEKAAALRMQKYPIGIFGLNHPENLIYNVSMTDVCAKAGVYFFIRDFLGYYEDRLYGYFKYREGLNGNRKRCMCKTEEMLVGPDGSVYRCHRDLYEGTKPIGNILLMDFDIEDISRPCNSFGLCNPCDLKLKLGPDLITSKCSVKITKS